MPNTVLFFWLAGFSTGSMFWIAQENQVDRGGLALMKISPEKRRQ
jgi:hypothetical protein